MAIVKHDSLDKAPLNDEALSRPQKLYSKSRFTSYKVYLLSQWTQACHAIKLPWVIVCYTPITSNCFHTEMGSILEQCVHRFPRWRRANRQSILLICRDWSHRRRCLPDGDKNKVLSLSLLSLSWFLQLLSPVFYILPLPRLVLSCLLPVSLPLHVSSFLIKIRDTTRDRTWNKPET